MNRLASDTRFEVLEEDFAYIMYTHTKRLIQNICSALNQVHPMRSSLHYTCATKCIAR